MVVGEWTGSKGYAEAQSVVCDLLGLSSLARCGC